MTQSLLRDVVIIDLDVSFDGVGQVRGRTKASGR